MVWPDFTSIGKMSAVGVVKLGLAVLITKTELVPIRLGLLNIFVAISNAYRPFP